MALPPLIPCGGDWNTILERLYTTFQSIFNRTPRFTHLGKPVVYDRRIEDYSEGKEEGFWHVVSRGKPGERLPDFRRAERLHWIEFILNGTHTEVSRFKHLHGNGKTRYYFWCEEEDFALILEEQRNVMTLVTSFYVDTQYKRDDLAAKRQRFITGR